MVGRRKVSGLGALNWFGTILTHLTYRLVSVQFCAVAVQGWGALGHEIVANLAWELISNETRHLVADILGNDAATMTKAASAARAALAEDPIAGLPVVATRSSCFTEFCSPLAAVADWADQARYEKAYVWSAPLHYIDIRDDLIDGGCPVPANYIVDKTYGGRANQGRCVSSGTRCDECFFNFSRDCVGDRCVAGAIVNYTHRLEQASTWRSSDSAGPRNGLRRTGIAEQSQLQESLKFLTHFLGDIHQPLHCSRTSDRGGNSIKVTWSIHQSEKNPALDETVNARAGLPHLRNRFQRSAAVNPYAQSRHRSHSIDNLHAVWDDGFINAALADRFNQSRTNMEQFLFSYIAEAARPRSSGATEGSKAWEDWVSCPNGGLEECASMWGQESWVLAMQFAYRDEFSKPVVTGETLTEEYYLTRLPIVYERLAAAGVRLAITLTKALSGPRAGLMLSESYGNP